MRTFILFIALAALSLSLGTAQAQPGANVNILSQPIWGPTGYDHVEYYYFPDIEAYYSVPKARYYVLDGDRWVARKRLPARFADFNVNTSYKAVVNAPTPYLHHPTYRDQYAGMKGRRDQQMIRDSRDDRYVAIKGHPGHRGWLKQRKHDNGIGGGRAKKH
jgi:hypothetical protein